MTASPSARLFRRQSRLRTLSRWLVRLLARVQLTETNQLLILAIVVGALTGLAAVAFIWMIDVVTWLGYGVLPSLIAAPGRLWLLIIPILGGLLAGPLISHYADELLGSGIPVVMRHLALFGGRIHPRVLITKLYVAAMCIGSGGSAGREGPIVHVGATIGSVFGQLLRMSDERVRNLVACGAAGGVAAAFNAPIAGVAFAIEVLAGDLGLGMVSNVVIAAVTASVVSRAFFGNIPAFDVPAYSLNAAGELLLYAVEGLGTALLGILLIQAIDRVTTLFANSRVHPWLRPAVGGLTLGLLGFLYPHLLDRLQFMPVTSRLALPLESNLPHVFGSGFETIEAILIEPQLWLALLLLIPLKIIATALTLGSGHSAGVFAPSLFIGAMFGGLFGLGVQQAFPGLNIQPGAYALAGMAATFAGAARAPLTAILIVFEMSNDYNFILPLMVATIAASVSAQRLFPETIYTIRLSRQGIRLRHGRDVDVLDGVLVREIMSEDIPTLHAADTMRQARRYFAVTHHHGAVVLDGDERLAGILTLSDTLGHDDAGADADTALVGDYMTKSLLTARPNDTIGAALQRMAVRNIGRMPVVASRDAGVVVGILRRGDIIRAYRHAILRRDDMQDRANQFRISRRLGGTEFVELHVRAGSAAEGVCICDLDLPPECLLTTRRHGDRMQLLHGDDVLEANDIVLALCEPQSVSALEAMFRPPTSDLRPPTSLHPRQRPHPCSDLSLNDLDRP